MPHSKQLTSWSHSTQSEPDHAVLLVLRAANFAAWAHCGQHRKGSPREPTVNHLAEVAHLLGEATHGRDPGLIAAGWLHDTLEDTAIEREQLEAEFGAAVADVVAEVSDDKSLPKHERKHRQIEDTPHKSRGARLIKLADKTSNLRSLAASPPAGWEAGRRLEYIEWAEAVVASCRGLNPFLEQRFDEAAKAARRSLTPPTKA